MSEPNHIPTIEDLKTLFEASLKNRHMAIPLAVMGQGFSALDALINAEDATSKEIAEHNVLTALVDQLHTYDAQYPIVLKKLYWDQVKTDAAAEALGYSSRFVLNSVRKKAIEALAQHTWHLETEFRTTKQAKQLAKLGTPLYDKVVGAQDVIEACNTLLSSTNTNAICLKGLGGIGKSTVADRIARDAIHAFIYDDIFWIRLSSRASNDNSHVDQLVNSLLPAFSKPGEYRRKEEKYSAVRNALHTRPYLIVVDNLEEHNNYEDLAQCIHDFANEHSKFILTSRVYPTSFASHNIAHVPIGELSFDAAQSLLIGHFKRVTPNDVDTHPFHQHAELIYDKVGGHPLALKLVSSMVAQGTAISNLLEDLERWYSKDVHNLYSHIYQKLWEELLSPNAKTLLRAMPIVADNGGSLADLSAFGNLKPKHQQPALEELIGYSLVENRGTSATPRYSTHSLTNTFLLRDIIQWPSYIENQKETDEKALFVKALKRAIRIWTQRTLRDERAFFDYANEVATLRNITLLGLDNEDTHQVVTSLLKSAFEMVWKNGEEQQWLHLVKQAIDVCQDHVTKAELYRQYGYYSRQKGDTALAIDAFEKCHALLQPDEAPETWIRAAIGLSYALSTQGRVDSAISVLTEGIDIADRNGIPEWANSCKVSLGILLIGQKKHLAAVRSIKPCKRFYESHEHTEDALRASSWLGDAYFDEYTASEEANQKSLRYKRCCALAKHYYAQTAALQDAQAISVETRLIAKCSQSYIHYLDEEYELARKHAERVRATHPEISSYHSIQAAYLHLSSLIDQKLAHKR